jgi:threonine synthase
MRTRFSCASGLRKWGWYNRNSGINPYLVEGKKTAGLEIGEQLGWQPPDWVAVSVGDGCTIAGVWKAFREMKTLGLIGAHSAHVGRAGGRRRAHHHGVS